MRVPARVFKSICNQLPEPKIYYSIRNFEYPNKISVRVPEPIFLELLVRIQFGHFEDSDTGKSEIYLIYLIFKIFSSLKIL